MKKLISILTPFLTTVRRQRIQCAALLLSALWLPHASPLYASESIETSISGIEGDALRNVQDTRQGHSSKQMVYQVYGEYVEDLEDDVEDIIRYFGTDFLIKPGKIRTPNLSYGDSFGVSLLPAHVTH